MNGIERIACERQRQIDQEGYSPEHDREHDRGELARAAACYAMTPGSRPLLPVTHPDGPHLWPFRQEDYKPDYDNRIHELVKAGALIAAEIDRLSAQAP